MTRQLTFVLAALAMVAYAAPAPAEEINFATATAERPNLLLARTGVDHGFVLDLGYRRVVEWGGHQLVLGADLGVPWASPDFGDYRVRAGVTVSLLGGTGRGFKLVGSFSPTMRATQNASGNDRSIGADVRLTGGYYGRWWLAGEVGLDWAATTYIENSAAYRAVYAGAKDGWYANPGGTLYAGVNTGVSIGSVDLVLRAGVPRTIHLAPQTIPMFALLGVNVTLPD